MIYNYEKVVELICDNLREFTDVAVVGLSGGADSTLVACLCVEALGKENVYGISMPYNDFDKETFNARSTKLANYLKINHFCRPIKNISDAIDEMITCPNTDGLTTVNSGNSRSRARMSVLYGFAHSLSTANTDKRVRVIGTGNLSEDFIGYDTKGGDALADIFPVGDLYKSEIYQLLNYFKDSEKIKEEHIDLIPSAGLEDGQTDEDDLGYTYNRMELSIMYCMNHSNDGEMEYLVKSGHVDEVIKFVWNRHLANKHKHEAPPVIAIRGYIDSMEEKEGEKNE